MHLPETFSVRRFHLEYSMDELAKQLATGQYARGEDAIG